MFNRRHVRLLVGLALGLGLGLDGCTLANPNHCFNLAIDTNGWCAAVHPERPYCSPCEFDEQYHGCVAEEPQQDECPAYTAPAGTESESGGSTGDSGTDTGTP